MSFSPPPMSLPTPPTAPAQGVMPLPSSGASAMAATPDVAFPAPETILRVPDSAFIADSFLVNALVVVPLSPRRDSTTCPLSTW